MNEQDKALIEVLCENIAPHINFNIFDHLLSDLIELGTIEADSAEQGLEMFNNATEGEDM